jgi:putative SOS response-associated peptidase YedK
MPTDKRGDYVSAFIAIVTSPEEYEIWLTAPAEEALKLQRPLPDEMLEIIAEDQRSDRPDAA